MDEIQQEIENILKKNLTETNVDRLMSSESEYREFIGTVLKLIFDVKYKELIYLLNQKIVDSNENIKKYAHELLDLYFSDEIKYSTSYILNKEQRVIFWYQGDKLYKYTAPYFIHTLLRFNENIIIFYRNKKSDNAPVASMVNRLGRELQNIKFPTKDDNACVNENISYYGGGGSGGDLNNSIISMTFTNGSCRFDFWCSYDLNQKKYIDSNFTK